jgi:hypothetical protein
MSAKFFFGVVALGLLAVPAVGEGKRLTLTVTAGKHDYRNTPVCVSLTIPKALAQVPEIALRMEGQSEVLVGQLCAPGIATEHIKPAGAGGVRRDLHFILPRLKSGAPVVLRAALGLPLKGSTSRYVWVSPVQDSQHDTLELVVPEKPGARRPVLRYMRKRYANWSPEARDQSYKVFHHLYDPSGRRFVTNGGNTDENITDPKKLLYPHHRGLMYAFNRITYDGGKHADTWHAKPGDTHEEHVRLLSVEGGPVLGRHRVLIDWRGPKNDVFAKEERELTGYNVPGGTLVGFASRLRTADGKVVLDGDPQHAGFQFRAANAVAEKTEKQTYFLRPDGKGKPDQTRNWPENKGHVNLPWDAMSFVLGGTRYTVAYLNSPKNPGEQRYSERAYGRIGCYFKYELTKDRPLVVRYRVWLQEGEMTVPQVQALSTAFVEPPRVAVK